MRKFINIKENLNLWDEGIKIYEDTFPKWERENSSRVLEKIQNDIYIMICLVEANEVKGFYILDFQKEFNYILFAFLVVKKECRGKGLGTILCKHGIDFFLAQKAINWLLIEAEEKQSLFYQTLGFKVLDFRYFLPAFNSKKSVKMDLLSIEKKPLYKENLTVIINDMFVRGYRLDKNDIRVKEQIDEIKRSKIVKIHPTK